MIILNTILPKNSNYRIFLVSFCSSCGASCYNLLLACYTGSLAELYETTEHFQKLLLWLWNKGKEVIIDRFLRVLDLAITINLKGQRRTFCSTDTSMLIAKLKSTTFLLLWENTHLGTSSFMYFAQYDVVRYNIT